MVELTYDPDARTLYAYFTEIDEGQDADQRELNGYFLLDRANQILGIHIDLGDDHHPRMLHYALEHDEVGYDQRGESLRIIFNTGQPVGHIDFPYPAIVDLDGNGHALGMEFALDPEFGIDERNEHMRPFIVQVFGDEDDEPPPNIAAMFGTPVVADEPEVDTYAGDDEADLETATEAPAVPAAPAIRYAEAPAEAEASDDDGEWTPMPEPELVRSGFVALVGKPNVGKSTLLNAYLNMKVSIVSPKPQTTRVAVRGILNRDDAQIVFVDTPGLHQPRSGLGEYMVESARRSIPDADVVCFVVDSTEPPTAADRRIAEIVKHARKPVILVLNKVDVARRADAVLQQYRDLGPWQTEAAVSAKMNAGLETLLERIVEQLPEGPRLFPADQVTDLSEREQVAELVREKVLLNTQQEVPHGVAVEVEEWEQRGERLYIRATINVERDSHKGIIIGEGGQMLKKIGAAARYEIERLLNRSIYLDLWVKVRRDWRSDPTSLRWLGYDIKKLR